MAEWFFNPCSSYELMAYVSPSLEISARGENGQVRSVRVYDFTRRAYYLIPATPDVVEHRRAGWYRLSREEGIWREFGHVPFKDNDKADIRKLLDVALGSRQKGEVFTSAEREIWNQIKAAVNSIRVDSRNHQLVQH